MAQKVNDFVAKAHQKVRTLRFINCLMGEKNKSVYLLFYIESLIESSTANFALKGIELEYTK
ncbi:hypothetical protein LBMAG51_09750 [Phycisphaerae bacterium]|nr:hypothetical protein LBMAG51_09750 [Phycisphaerae bacterium]